MANPAYKIEKARQGAAATNNIEELKKLYSKKLPEIKDLNKPEFWDDIYSEKNKLKFQSPMTRDRIRKINNLIPHAAIKILDIGAGLGWVEEVISSEKQIFANDFSPEAVDYLKKNFKGSFKVASIYKLDYKKNYFDVVLALEVLEHIPPSKIFSVLKSIKQLLRVDGVMIVSVPTNEGLEQMKYNPSGHVRMYTEELISAELEIAGFKIEEIQTIFAFDKFYKLKTLIATMFHSHKQNNIIIKASI